MKGAVRSLKSVNMKWLISMTIFDIIVAVVCIAPHDALLLPLSSQTLIRGLSATAIPVIVLLLVDLLPHNVKAIFVYWKVKDPLPGCEAFTKYALSDARIDMIALKRNIGALPTDPREQNQKWFKLYRMVLDDITVSEAHRLYLLYRDMAAISLPLLFLIPAGLCLLGASSTAQGIAAAILAIQFLACSTAARHNGIRLICNVLSLHSTRKISSKASSNSSS